MAQHSDNLGGLLGEPGGPPLLGADNLASGIASAGAVPATSNLPTSFDPWRNLSDLAIRQRAFRESVLCGVDLFASREFRLPDSQRGDCATCHRPGSNRSFDIGTTNLPTALLTKGESPELPLFRITRDASAPSSSTRPDLLHSGPRPRTHHRKMRGRRLHPDATIPGLTARAPYFANGSAGDLTELVDFYDRRFRIGLTEK